MMVAGHCGVNFELIQQFTDQYQHHPKYIFNEQYVEVLVSNIVTIWHVVFITQPI